MRLTVIAIRSSIHSGHTKMVLGVGGLANQMALLRYPHGSVIGQRRAEERHLIGQAKF